jgi:hypothetical protein
VPSRVQRRRPDKASATCQAVAIEAGGLRRDDDGARIAFGDQLERTADRPIARLRQEAQRITREDLWPDQSDIGRPVILPGGEVGILRSWWNAPDGSEWR